MKVRHLWAVIFVVIEAVEALAYNYCQQLDGDVLRRTPLQDTDLRLESPNLAAKGWPDVAYYAMNVFNVAESGADGGDVDTRKESRTMLPLLKSESVSILFSCNVNGGTCQMEVAAESETGLAKNWELQPLGHLTIPIYPSAVAWLKVVNDESHIDFGKSGGYDWKTHYTYGLFRGIVAPTVVAPSGIMGPHAIELTSGVVVIHLKSEADTGETRYPSAEHIAAVVEQLASLRVALAGINSTLVAGTSTQVKIAWAGVRETTSKNFHLPKWVGASTLQKWWATVILATDSAIENAQQAGELLKKAPLASFLTGYKYVALRVKGVSAPADGVAPVEGAAVSLPDPVAGTPPQCGSGDSGDGDDSSNKSASGGAGSSASNTAMTANSGSGSSSSGSDSTSSTTDASGAIRGFPSYIMVLSLLYWVDNLILR